MQNPSPCVLVSIWSNRLAGVGIKQLEVNMSLRFGASIFFLLSGFASAAPSVPGIDNFYQVDDHVYRGAQPTEEGFRYLAKIGVKTVVDLRESDHLATAEETLVTGLGMHFVGVPMTGLTPPTDAEITKILGLLEGAQAGAVFVHCKRGADRTGAVIAAYRIDQDHWDNARALREAMSRSMSVFQGPRQKFIRDFHPRGPQAVVQTANSATDEPHIAETN
jgi:tyrosine-protein phosphatase SIW14